MQSADRLIEPAVKATLEALELEPEDAALSKLAERYARELDQASAVSASADRVLSRIDADEDPDTYELLSALRNKLSARTAVENLGPKLHAALNELGATPKARKQATTEKETSRGPSRLAAFREKAQGA